MCGGLATLVATRTQPTTMEYVNNLDRTEITRLVRLERQSATATADTWALTPISTGKSGALVYRAKGSGSDRGAQFTWSLILKYCTNIGRFNHKYALDDPNWQREILLGQSGLLDDLSAGLRPPRFIDARQQSPAEIALWLEDVGDNWAEDWPLTRYGLAAFHLGQFNAHYAGRPPQDHWLGRDQWSDYVKEFCPSAIQGLKKHQDHPEVLAVYPRPIQQRLYDLTDACTQLIAHAHALSPLTLYHGDPSGRNLFDYQGTTVAIDWFDTGIAPLGEEIARMVGSSMHWFFIGRMDRAPALVETVLTRYIEGLRAAGWQGDPAVVSYTFKAALGTIYALCYTGIANGIVENRIEDRARNAYKTTVPELLTHMGEISRFCLDQADAARALAQI